jgi:putative ABC transport system permease protein
MDRLWLDIRFAARSLSRAPALTAVAIFTLAFGIGANTAVFSLVNTVLIRPLPYVDPARLVMLFETRRDSDHGNVSPHEYIAWARENRSFDHLAMFSYSSFTLSERGEPLTVSARIVTSNFFDVLGQRPILGRAFQTGDDQPGAPKQIILSHSIWISRFAGDSSVVGKQAVLDDTPFRIVGVMPARGDMDADVWVPVDLVAEARKVGKHGMFVVGRLKPGATIRTATADLTTVAERLEQQYPVDNKDHRVQVLSLNEVMVGDVRRPFLVALGAAFFVLLIACANVGHLLLTRAAARQKELAIRTALGAARSRLVRQLVTEALLLSVAGGALGLVLAVWLTDLFPALSAIQVPRISELRVDWRVLSATAFLCVFTALACGLVPALRASQPKLRLWLADGTRASSAPGRRIAGILIISEIALALMLLVGAGLTVKSFARLIRIDPGFDPRNVLAVSFPLPGPRYPTFDLQRRAVTDAIDGLSQLPDVAAVGATTLLPLGACCNSIAVTIEGRPAPAPGQEIQARSTVVAGRYFEASRIPLKRGRFFAATDARLSIPLIRWYPQQPNPPRFDEDQAPPVAIINETMARTFWPNEDAVGKRFRVLFSPWVTVVGIVGDVRQSGLLEPPVPQMYLSNLQEPTGAMTLVVRATRDPLGVASVVRKRIRAFDPRLPIGSIETMDQIVWNSVGRPRFNALLLGISGAIALLLAIIGVYGVMSYSVQRRTHELGIRRALGAQTHDVLRLVLGQTLALVVAGIVAGAIGAIALTRVLATLLYDVAPTDPATFATVAAILALVALLAGYLPGRRATRVDPTDALRSE